MSGDKKSEIEIHIVAFILVLMSAEWILLVAGIKPHEMLVGTVAVLAAALFLCVILRSQTIAFNFLLSDICAVWRVPWYILTNTYTLCDVLAKDLFGLEKAGSYYRVSRFQTSKKDPTLVARRVLATAYTTVSPNSIVIGIDCEQNRLLLHQVKRDEVSEMTKKMSGQP